MTETWARCEPCQRWYYCPTDSPPDRPPACPVCDQPPSSLRVTESPEVAAG